MKCGPFVRLVVACSLLFGIDSLFYAQSSAPTRTRDRFAAVSASQLDELVAQGRYVKLERDLSAAELTTSDRTYFEGILADRTHHVADAIALLEKMLPDLKAHDAHPTSTACTCAPRTATQEVFVEQFSRLFHQYREAPSVEVEQNEDVWNSVPAEERERMLTAARLAIQELDAARPMEESRRYFAKPGQTEWGC